MHFTACETLPRNVWYITLNAVVDMHYELLRNEVLFCMQLTLTNHTNNTDF